MLIGVDWGGTKIEAIVLGQRGEEHARRRVATPQGDYRGCVAAIAAMVAALAAETGLGAAAPVGIGLPGSLDPRTGQAKGANSTWILGHQIARDLVAALGRPVRLDNDANCLAVSEAVDGAGAGRRVVFAAILGTGAGAGIAIEGRAHAGPNNGAGEWGHNPLPFATTAELPGAACYCGRHGCLETWVSGTGFARDYARHAQDAPEAAEIVRRMRAGEHLARLVFARYLDRLARGLAVVLNVLDPDILVLGGGMSNIEELYAELPPRLAAATFSPVFLTPVVRAAHGDASGVRGAAWLCQA
jgi:fructokinase